VATGVAAVRVTRVSTAGAFARGRVAVGAAVVVLAIAVPAKALWYRRGARPAALPGNELASAASHARCVMSDSPMALVELDALSHDLADGCPNWVDVTGRTYSPDMAVRAQDGRPLPRASNPRWQQDLRDYLLSGDAVIISRSKDAGISPATWQAIVSGGVLATDGAHTIYSVDAHRVGDSGNTFGNGEQVGERRADRSVVRLRPG
jgi:alpha-1,2-mannosyltransferase